MSIATEPAYSIGLIEAEEFNPSINPNTPAKFADGQGDFQHIGLVCSVNPLRIVHASSAAGCVTTDTKLGKWAFWGWLKDVAKDAAPTTPEKGGETLSTKTAIVMLIGSCPTDYGGDNGNAGIGYRLDTPDGYYPAEKDDRKRRCQHG